MSDFWYRSGPSLRSGGRPHFSVILPDLLIGEYLTAADAEWLRSQQGVTAVLSLQDEADLMSKDLNVKELCRAYDAHALEFERIGVPDGDSAAFAGRLEKIVSRLADLLDRGHRVYVHCNAGMNRAPTVVIAYLHVHQGMSLEGARDFVKSKRPCVPYMQMLIATYRGEEEDS